MKNLNEFYIIESRDGLFYAPSICVGEFIEVELRDYTTTYVGDQGYSILKSKLELERESNWLLERHGFKISKFKVDIVKVCEVNDD